MASTEEGADSFTRVLGRAPHSSLCASFENLPQGFIEWTPAQGSPALAQQVHDLVKAAGQYGCGLEAQLEPEEGRCCVTLHPIR